MRPCLGGEEASCDHRPVRRFAYPLLFATVTAGCVLLHTGTDGNGGDAGNASTSTAQGAASAGGSGGATGGSGGAGGGCDQVVAWPPGGNCPNDFDFFAFGTDANITIDLGVVSTVSGRTTLVGSHDAPFTVPMGGPTFDYVATYKNYFILPLNASGAPQAGYSVRIGFNQGATHVVATSDGGVVVAFRGAAFRLDGAPSDIPGLNDSNQDDALLVKLSATGSYEWHLQLEGSSNSMSIDLLQLDLDGNLLVGCSVASGVLLLKRDNSGGESFSFPGPRMYLLTYDIGGTRTGLDSWLGDAKLGGAGEVDGFRYLVGSYAGPFPEFGISSPPEEATIPQLFAVQLNGAGEVAEHRAFGFSARENTVLGMVDTDNGLALIAQAEQGSLVSQFNGASTALRLRPNEGSSYVVRLTDTLEVEWIQANVLTGTAKATAGFIPQTGGLATAHVLSDPGAVSFDGSMLQSPPTQSLFVKLDGCGVPAGSAEVQPPAAALAAVTASSTACGDLAFGTHAGPEFMLFDGTIPTSPALRTQGIVLFRTAGIPFE